MLRFATLVLVLSTLALPTDLLAQDAARAGSVITHDKARQLTRGFTHALDGTRSYLYSKRPFLELLGQEGVEGIRFSYGRRDGRGVLVAVGTDARGADLGGILVDSGEACPPFCTETLAPVVDVAKAGAVISRAEAKELTRDFTYAVDGIRSHLYSAALFRNLLTQPGAEGLRIYPATVNGRRNAEPRLVFLATDGQGQDMRGMILDDGASCPPMCPEK